MATMMVHHHHHHHHVYGSGTQPLGGDQEINDAYMAGVAAGRADALERAGQHALIAAVYDSPRRQLPLQRVAPSIPGKGVPDNKNDGEDEDAKSINGDVHDDRKPKFGNGIDDEDARLAAIAICRAEGINVPRGFDMPSELIALGSLILTLDIPVQYAMCPANEFTSPRKGKTQNATHKKLNARQRRTLRRAQERASKELQALQHEFEPPVGYAPQVYSPTCMGYGVHPHAFADYNFMMMHNHSSGIPPSPTHAMGFGHPQMMAPAPASGVHHHQQPPPPRMMSRFAQQQEHNHHGNVER